MHDNELIRNGVLVSFLDTLLPLFITFSQSLAEIVVKVASTRVALMLDIVFVDFDETIDTVGDADSPVETCVDGLVEIVLETCID